MSDGIGRITTCTASPDTRPTGTERYEGKVVWETDTNKLMVWNGTEWREIFDVDGWTTYAPAIGGTGFAIGNGTLAGLYRLHPDKRYEWFASVVFGGTSTYGAGPLTITNPATLTATNLLGALAGASAGIFNDTSASADYPCKLAYSSTTTSKVVVHRYDPTLGAANYVTLVGVTSAIPVTLASGDSIYVYGTGWGA